MKKHAYLIMAHNDFEMLKELLKALDDDRNDIYLHIDKKVNNFDFSEYNELLCKSQLYLIKDRLCVSWGGDTQIKCEMLLLKTAFEKHYAYYHLLSGVDYPLKSQDYIHDFFNKNFGKNFIDYESNELSYQIAKNRIQYKHYFQNIIGNGQNKLSKYCYYLDLLSCKMQKLFGINRLNNMNTIKKGANWFSITDDMVKIVLESGSVIKKTFYNGICADELFLQTIAYNSNLKDTIVNDCLRYTIWLGGAHPKILGPEDYESLMNSSRLFARKFTSNNSLTESIKHALENK